MNEGTRKTHVYSLVRAFSEDLHRTMKNIYRFHSRCTFGMCYLELFFIVENISGDTFCVRRFFKKYQWHAYFMDLYFFYKNFLIVRKLYFYTKFRHYYAKIQHLSNAKCSTKYSPYLNNFDPDLIFIVFKNQNMNID